MKNFLKNLYFIDYVYLIAVVTANTWLGISIFSGQPLGVTLFLILIMLLNFLSVIKLVYSSYQDSEYYKNYTEELENEYIDKELLERSLKYLKSRSLSATEYKSEGFSGLVGETIPVSDIQFIFSQLINDDGDLIEFFDLINKHLKEEDKF